MDGILNIDKPEGWTSHDVVARVRRILREKRVGHTGTLDPFATGVLVVMVGRATRLAQFLSGDAKEYEALVRFGFATGTGDATGERVSVDESEALRKDSLREWGVAEIEAALSSLRGEIEQVPPMYSAKKIGGRKLYELARKGETIEREARRVQVYEFAAVPQPCGRLLVWNEDGTCDMTVRVKCSAGTYVRVLAEDLGKQLGVGAHLASLRRTRAGGFRIEDSLTIDELQTKAEAGAANLLVSMDAALSSLPFVHLTADEARRASHGMAVSLISKEGAEYPEGQRVRMRDEGGNLLAVGAYDSRLRLLRPVIVLGQSEK